LCSPGKWECWVSPGIKIPEPEFYPQDQIMKRDNLHHAARAAAILLVVVACALPAQTIQPTPRIDPNAIETAIVGTLQASNREAQPPGSTTTATVSSTEAPASPAIISSYGTSLVLREDGSKEFRDYRAGIQIVFPPNWLAMRVGEPEYYEAWEKEGAQNPHLLDAITSTQTLDLNRFRITAYDMHPEHVLYENLPKINIVFVQDDGRTLKQIDADERNAPSPLSERKFLPSDFTETASGLPILVIQYQWKSSDATRSYISLYKGVLFKVPTGTVAIDLFIPFDHKETIAPEYDQIINSLTLLSP
jgi:hypothetical protein